IVERDGRSIAQQALGLLEREVEALDEKIEPTTMPRRRDSERTAAGLAHHGRDQKRAEREIDGAQRFPERARDAFHELAGRKHVLTGYYDRLPDRFRARCRELEACHEVVDIDRMVLVRAPADDRNDAAVHEPEELDQTPVARPVRFGDAHYRPSQPIAAACDLALRLELRARIDVLGARGGRLVEPPGPRRAVDADRAAVYETLDAGFLADVEQISRAVHVDGAVIGLADVRFVLCRRQMKDRVDRRDELAYQR